jgi:hypothetical protein
MQARMRDISSDARNDYLSSCAKTNKSLTVLALLRNEYEEPIFIIHPLGSVVSDKLVVYLGFGIVAFIRSGSHHTLAYALIGVQLLGAVLIPQRG